MGRNVRFTVMRVMIRSVVVAVLFVPAVAHAQGPPPPPRHEATGEAAFVGVSGNAASNTFGLGGEIIARPSSWMFRHKASFIRNETKGVLNVQSFLYSPRAQKTVSERLGLFVEYAYFRDRFAGVASRNALSAGVSVKVVAAKSQTLALDLGGGYLNEHRLTGTNVSSAIYTVGAGYKAKLSDTADLSEDLAVLGVFSHSTDWRLANAIALTARVSSVLSLKVSNTTRFAHFPAPGFKTTDTTTAVALVARFASKTVGKG